MAFSAVGKSIFWENHTFFRIAYKPPLCSPLMRKYGGMVYYRHSPGKHAEGALVNDETPGGAIGTTEHRTHTPKKKRYRNGGFPRQYLFI